MKAIILSAGKGTRMQEVSDDLPKVLLPILGKPMLQWNIELLKNNGIEDIAINTHHMADKIKEFIGDGSDFGVKVRYSYEPQLLGTSGSLNNFKDFFNECFVVLYGDVISRIDLRKLIDFHKNNRALATLVVHKSEHPEDSDIVQINDENKILKLIHKPGNTDYGDLSSAAVYVLEPRIFNYLPASESDFVKDVFSNALKNGEELKGYLTHEFIKDAGTPERKKQVENYLENNLRPGESNVYKEDYFKELKRTIEKIDKDQINSVEGILKDAKVSGKKIFLIGNGGSASTSEHLANDFIKISKLKAFSLTSVSVITTFANDEGFDSVFVEPLKSLLEEGDVVIGISGSGNSENVVRALEYTNQNGGISVGFVGFGGGKIKEIAKKHVHIASDNYGIIEDLHLSVGHYLSHKLR